MHRLSRDAWWAVYRHFYLTVWLGAGALLLVYMSISEVTYR